MLEGRTLVAGRASGRAVVLEEPLSFWGGLDPETGRLIDVHHRQMGTDLAGCILVMPSGRGSSSSSSVLAEALRTRTAPAGVILLEPDPIVALGSIVARELYGIPCPVVALERDAFVSIHDGTTVEIDASDELARVSLA